MTIGLGEPDVTNSIGQNFCVVANNNYNFTLPEIWDILRPHDYKSLFA